MSTPVRGADGPLGYAPRWARTTKSGRADTALDVKLRTPTTAQESQDFRPPLVVMSLQETVSPQEMVPFEDAGSEPEAATAREPASHRDRRLTRPSGTQQVPARASPPLYPLKTSIFASVGRLVSVMILAAAGALGFLWLTAPRGAPPQLASNPGGGEVASPASYPPQKPPSAAPASRAAVPAVTAPVALPTPPVAAPDHNEVAGLLARGRAYLSEGDVALARLYLRRAAERYDPQAALALGGTYDPAELRRIGIPNFQAQADPAKAREWYRRAADLGSAAAALRLERLP
jgi:hypothetical protein